jgi:hypothetical protein
LRYAIGLDFFQLITNGYGVQNINFIRVSTSEAMWGSIGGVYIASEMVYIGISSFTRAYQKHGLSFPGNPKNWGFHICNGQSFI